MGTPEATALPGAETADATWLCATDAAACTPQLACVDQKESYVSAWFVAPNVVAPADGDAGALIGNGELETYAFAR